MAIIFGRGGRNEKVKGEKWASNKYGLEVGESTEIK
jgi:hypothetical protein